MSGWIDPMYSGPADHEDRLLCYFAIHPAFGYAIPFFFFPPFFSRKSQLAFVLEINCEQWTEVYHLFWLVSAPEDHMPLQFPKDCLVKQVAHICCDSRLIHSQLPWLQPAYEENEEVMSPMLVSLLYYYIISPNLGSHPAIV